MPLCQFGERQYELAANLELLSGSGKFFTPTLGAEERLGIDAALTPGDPHIWRLLGVPPPPGAQVGPRTFSGWPANAPAGASPPFLVALFLQYKRSRVLTRASAKEWRDHNQREYWRVELTTHQHDVLRALEQSVGSDGEVRYAAPRFWKYEDMWQWQGASGVLDNSLFFRPSDVPPGHTRVTWSPAAGMLFHSEPHRIETETSVDFARNVRRRRERAARTPRDYVGDLAARLSEIAPSGRGRDEWVHALHEKVLLDEMPDVPPETETALADLAVLAEVAQTARASLLLLALSERPAAA